MSHHMVTIAAAEQAQQLQAQACHTGDFEPWSRVAFGVCHCQNAKHGPSSQPVPIPEIMLCHLGSEHLFSSLTEIKPRARVFFPGPALAALPPAQEILHAAATAPTLLRAFLGGQDWAPWHSPWGTGRCGNSGELGLDPA